MNVILITIDSLRADKVGCYSQSELTPNIDCIAEKAIIFDQVITHSTVTDPSHCSILTGTYPFIHGVRENGWRFDGKIPTIAQILLEKGYKTVAAVSVEHLSSFFGLNRGFNTYFNNHPLDSLYHKYGKHKIKIGKRTFRLIGFLRAIGIYPMTHQRSGNETNKVVFKWLEKNHSNKDFFMWIHYFDVHRPYKKRLDYWGIKRGATYDDRVKLVDQYVGELIKKLRKLNELEDSLIVITSDHGEALGEHGYEGHGKTLYDEELRVPLIISYPSFSKKTIHSQGRSIDIMPTILDILDINIPNSVQGESLLSHRRPDARYGYAEIYPYLKCLRTDRWKLIVTDETKELYNLKKDPHERRNLASKKRNIVKEFECVLKKLTQNRIVEEQQEVEEHIKEALRNLGYG